MLPSVGILVLWISSPVLEYALTMRLLMQAQEVGHGWTNSLIFNIAESQVVFGDVGVVHALLYPIKI